jgi:hypothetical protein
VWETLDELILSGMGLPDLDPKCRLVENPKNISDFVDAVSHIRKKFKAGREQSHPERTLFKKVQESNDANIDTKRKLVREMNLRLHALLNVCFAPSVMKFDETGSERNTYKFLSCKYFILALCHDFLKEIVKCGDRTGTKKSHFHELVKHGEEIFDNFVNTFLEKIGLYLRQDCNKEKQLHSSKLPLLIQYKPTGAKLVDILRTIICNFNHTCCIKHIDKLVEILIKFEVFLHKGLAFATSYYRPKQCSLIERNINNGAGEAVRCWLLLLRLLQQLLTTVGETILLHNDEEEIQNQMEAQHSLFEACVMQVSGNVISILEKLGGIASIFSFLAQEDDKELIDTCLQIQSIYFSFQRCIEDDSKGRNRICSIFSISFTSFCRDVLTQLSATGLDIECIFVHFSLIAVGFDCNVCVDMLNSRETETFQYLLKALKILACRKCFDRNVFHRACSKVLDTYQCHRSTFQKSSSSSSTSPCTSASNITPTCTSRAIILSNLDTFEDKETSPIFCIERQEWLRSCRAESNPPDLPYTADGLFNSCVQFLRNMSILTQSHESLTVLLDSLYTKLTN